MGPARWAAEGRRVPGKIRGIWCAPRPEVSDGDEPSRAGAPSRRVTDGRRVPGKIRGEPARPPAPPAHCAPAVGGPEQLAVARFHDAWVCRGGPHALEGGRAAATIAPMLSRRNRRPGRAAAATAPPGPLEQCTARQPVGCLAQSVRWPGQVELGRARRPVGCLAVHSRRRHRVADARAGCAGSQAQPERRRRRGMPGLGACPSARCAPIGARCSGVALGFPVVDLRRGRSVVLVRHLRLGHGVEFRLAIVQ
jgi:hypothetical protein